MPALSAGNPFSTLSIRGGWVQTTENPKPDFGGFVNFFVHVKGVLPFRFPVAFRWVAAEVASGPSVGSSSRYLLQTMVKCY